MTMAAWLFTIEQELEGLEVGDPFNVWTDPPRLTATGEVRRRSDGDPFTPAWRVGEGVVVYHPASERCVALLTVDGPPEWNEDEELFFTDTVIQAFDPLGPTLADIGVPMALQGGRHRLTPSQHGAASKRLRKTP